MLSFFPRGVLDEILNLIESVSGVCSSYFNILGYVFRQGQVKTIEAKVKAISDFPVPTCKRQLVRFLGMTGHYRNFCDNFSASAEPLTNLLSKRTKFIWTNDCQTACDILKAILKNEPALLAQILQKNLSWRLTLVILVQAVFSC